MREFTIGGVLRRASLIFRAHAGLLIGIALLLVGVPQIFAFAFLQSAATAHPGLLVLSTLVQWLCGLLLQAVVIRVGLDDANRRTSSAGQLAGTAVRSFFPVLLVSLLVALTVFLASLLLVVPGVMLFCRWYLVVPVKVAEQSGVVGSINRSAQLTDGVRWRVFGLTLVAALIGFVLTFGAGLIGGFVTGLSHNPWPGIVGQAIGIALFTLLPALASTAAYLGLREVKEGALSEDMVSVFD